MSDLCGLIRRLSRKLVFLSKTKCSKMEMEGIRTELGNILVFMLIQGGGLGARFVWDTYVQLNSSYYSSNHMDATI